MNSKILVIMKNRIIYTLIALSSLFIACESQTGEWEDEISRIQFTGDATLTKSFIFDTPDVLTDTVFLTLHTIGYTSNKAREFSISQINIENEDNAIEGENYLSLKSEGIKKYLFVEPAKSYIRVPIVILRESLVGKILKAKFVIVENDNFKFGLKDSLSCIINMSNSYEKPSNYDKKATTTMGIYSKVKHEFMHQVLVKNNFAVPDEAFFDKLAPEGTSSFYVNLFRRELKEYNDNHPGDPLTSEPLLPTYPNGILIKFEKDK